MNHQNFLYLLISYFIMLRKDNIFSKNTSLQRETFRFIWNIKHRRNTPSNITPEGGRESVLITAYIIFFNISWTIIFNRFLGYCCIRIKYRIGDLVLSLSSYKKVSKSPTNNHVHDSTMMSSGCNSDVIDNWLQRHPEI